ncbi:Rib/alpha-like domain-containing protein [Trueperella pyogenes]|uniref:Rib/alpha-like domain-containing protein n=1 Tax=Trueperella pyogenes TaxID=1661 RepID=UPI003250677F
MAVVGTTAIVATGLAGGGAIAAPTSDGTGGATAVRSIGTAIESTGTGNAPYTVSGTARFIESYASNNPGVDYKGPIAGVKVYVQWREGVGNANFPYSYSPIYYSTADDQGNFSIDMKPYFDSIGRVRYFEGRVDTGAAGTKDFAGNDSRLGWREKVRIWAELPDGTKADYRLINHYATTWAPADPTLDNTVMATWDSGKSSIRDVVINYAKNTDNVLAKPDRNDWAVSGEGNNVGNGLDGSVGGTVFWNANVPNGAIDFSSSMLYQGGADYPLSGITIQGSYLSDEAVAAIKAHATAAFAGKTLRGTGWTADDENALQAWISEQIKADPTWVAETVTSTTGADGKYKLYFRGIYGNSADACGITGAKCHQLADSWNAGSFLNGGVNSKHTNWDWMYVAPVDLPNNVGVMSPWSIQRWQRADGRGTWNGANFGQVGFAVGPTIDSVTLADILLSPAPLEFDVVNYDTQLNPAAPGDTAKTYTGGVLTNENLTYDIVWTDEKGTPVHECTGLRPETNLSLASCDYQVPADLATDTVYTATLYGVNADTNARGEVLASDAFLATRGTELPWGSKYSDYTAEALPQASNGTTLSGLSANGLPDGLSMDPNTGKITGQPTVTGRYVVKVTGDASVPLANGGSADIKLARTYIIVVTDTPLKPGVRGTEYSQEVVPTGFEDSGYTLGEIKSVDNLPAGLTYNADTKTITGTPTVVVAADEQNPNVTVIYAVTRETPGGPETKEVKDVVPFPVITGDSDGDKVPDPVDPDNPQPGEDQCPGTPEGVTVDENGCSAAQLFEPAYADSSVEAGKSATVSPTFTKKDTEGAVDAPEGTTFALGEGAPDWAKIDPNTGEITFTPGADVAAGDVQVPVVVTYPDNGGTDAVNAKVTVTVTDTDGDKVPDGKDQCPGTPAGVTVDTNGCAVAPSIPAVPAVNGVVNTPIDPVVVPVDNPGQATDLVCTATGLADGLEIAYDADKGACVITGTPTAPIDGDYTVTVTGKAPDGDKGKVSESGTGKITVTKPEAPEPGDKDGDKVTDDKDQCPGTPEGVTVDENGCSAAQLFEPAYADSSVEAGKSATVSPTFTKKDTEGAVDAPEGTTFALGEGAPDWAKIDPNTGEITFTPGADVAAGDVQVPVVVTYPDNGGTDAVNAKVTVTVTDTDGDKVPDGKDQCPGTPAGVTVDTNGCAVAPSIPAVPAVNGVVNTPIDPVVVPVDNPGQATDLVCTATGLADGLEIAYDADKGACVITGTPTAPIDGDYTVTVTGKAPDGDKGKVSESGTGKITVTKPEAPAAPDWGNGSGKPGETVVIPNEGGPVPDGSKVETDGPGKVVIDENGNVVVNVDKDAKPGDKITVTVKDKDGNEIDKIEVTVADPDKQPEADKPNWGDGSVKPGETVVIPNDGGKVPDGAKVTVDGPGKAQIDENGNLVITADPNAKPGDKITVTVTDKDGNVLDTSTITVAGKAAPKSGKLPYTGATVGGLAAAATMLTAAGAFLVSRKRRED